MLLGTVVQVTLEALPLLGGRGDDPLAGSRQMGQLRLGLGA